MSNEQSQDEIMLHDALSQVLKQAEKMEGRLGTISLAIRHDARIGKHVHAAASVTHRIFVTVQSNEVE